jgi:hypothetical protein
MKRLIGILVVGGSVAAAIPLLPGPTVDVILPPPEPWQAAVCPAVRADDRSASQIAVAAEVPGEALAVFTLRGSQQRSHPIEVTEAGGGWLEVGSVVSEGLTPAALEMPTAAGAAALLVGLDERTGAAACPMERSSLWLLPGGSSRSGQALDLVIANPFAGPARVAVRSASELGLDSVARLASLELAPRSVAVVDLAGELPLRDLLAVTVEVSDGQVVPALLQTGGADAALWEGVAGRDEWLVVLPEWGEGTRRLVISTDSPLAVPFQVESFAADVEMPPLPSEISSGGVISVDLSGASSSALALRVTAAAPVAATVVLESELSQAAAPAAPAAGRRWLIPGVGLPAEAVHRLWVYYGGAQPTPLSIRALRDRGPVVAVELQPGMVNPIELVGDFSPGVLVEAAEPVVVLWTRNLGDTIDMSTGRLLDG